MEMDGSKQLIYLEVSSPLGLCGWKPWLEAVGGGWCCTISNQEIPVLDCVPTKFASDQPFSPTIKPTTTTAFQPDQLFLGVSPLHEGTPATPLIHPSFLITMSSFPPARMTYTLDKIG